MNIDRSKYYSNDKYGNMLFNITRCFNDMMMAKRLLNSIDSGKYESDDVKISYSLYISKFYFGHLKEALKLLNIIYTKKDYNSYFCNDEILELLKKIINEIEFTDDSLNKKYLDIRHDAFHYDTTDNKNIEAFKKANQKLHENNFKEIKIKIKNDEYEYELASDILTLTKYFNCDQIPKDITCLYNKVLKILKCILTNTCNKKFKNMI